MNEFLLILEDRPGSLADCCEALGEAGINILGGAGIATSVAAIVIVTEEAEETAAALTALSGSRGTPERCLAAMKACVSWAGEHGSGGAEAA